MVAYGPEFNPIERVWAQVKLLFKKERMNAMLLGGAPDFEKLLRRIMMAYPPRR